MAGIPESRAPITFDEVAVLFSGEEWELLSDQQRALYMEVMKENYEHFIYLGFRVPIILSWLQKKNVSSSGKVNQESPNPVTYKDPAAIRVKTEVEDPAYGYYSHPENGTYKKSSKRSQSTTTNIKDEPVYAPIPELPFSEPPSSEPALSSPPTHGRNLRARKLFTCTHCEISFNYSSALEAHCRVHSGDKPHKCDYCKKTFGYKSELIVHRRKHNKSSKTSSKSVPEVSPKPVTKPALNEPATKSALNEPASKPAPSESRTVQPSTSVNGYSERRNPSPPKVSSPKPESYSDLPVSPSTSGSFSPRGTLPQIESEKPLKCNYCEKRFNDQTILEAHHRIHTGKLAYACTMCDKSFSKPSLLAAHNNTHREGKPFQCDMCDKNFNDQSLLMAHQRTHTGEKPYKCNHCPKWFPNRETLIEHEESHLKPKPFKCRHCEKSFNDKSLLVTHEGVHTDTKPFKCNQCNESFFLKTQLVTHLSKHAPNKPHPCNLCDRSFNKKETLLAHVRVHNMQNQQGHKRQKK